MGEKLPATEANFKRTVKRRLAAASGLLAFGVASAACSDSLGIQSAGQNISSAFQRVAGHAQTGLKGRSADNDTASADTTVTRQKRTIASLPDFSKYTLVALGGSYAAGGGLGGMSADTEKGCRHSPDSYPSDMAGELGMRLVQDTCDGAKSWQILDETLGRKIEKFPSLADDRYASSDHITNFKNTIFTLTVGANDGAFIRLEKDCLTTGCSTAQGTAYETTLAATGRDISGIVQNLKAADASLIVVNEYPAPDWGDTSCLDSQSTSRDQTILRTELHNLNTTIADSAQSAGAVVVAPTDFKDHGICAIDPWIQWRGVGGTMALHPTAAGQQALAARNEAAVRAYVENN